MATDFRAGGAIEPLGDARGPGVEARPPLLERIRAHPEGGSDILGLLLLEEQTLEQLSITGSELGIKHLEDRVELVFHLRRGMARRERVEHVRIRRLDRATLPTESTEAAQCEPARDEPDEGVEREPTRGVPAPELLRAAPEQLDQRILHEVSQIDIGDHATHAHEHRADLRLQDRHEPEHERTLSPTIAACTRVDELEIRMGAVVAHARSQDSRDRSCPNGQRCGPDRYAAASDRRPVLPRSGPECGVMPPIWARSPPETGRLRQRRGGRVEPIMGFDHALHRHRLVLTSLGLVVGLASTACADEPTGPDDGVADEASAEDSGSVAEASAEAADDASTDADDDASDDAPSTDDGVDSGDDDDADGSGGTPGEPYVPDGVLFFDGFDYEVTRDADDKFGAEGRFGAHGWAWGKDAVLNGTGAGGWLYTTGEVSGSTEPLPGVDSTHVLCIESGAGTYAGVIEGEWRQTDFYLQYGDTEAGPLDTIPPDVWIQHWMYIADTPAQPSLFPPTSRLGKWFYPTRNSFPSTDLEWLFAQTGVMIDSEVQELGSSAQLDIGYTSLAEHLALTDTDGTIYTDGRPDAASSLGHAGSNSDHLTPITANAWWLLRVHIDHSVVPGVVEVSIRQQGGDWIDIIDTETSAVVEWTPVNTTDGHRGLRWPTTMSNWYQEGNQQTTHGDWWIYIDDFAIAAGAHAGGAGAADLPQYPF